MKIKKNEKGRSKSLREVNILGINNLKGMTAWVISNTLKIKSHQISKDKIAIFQSRTFYLFCLKISQSTYDYLTFNSCDYYYRLGRLPKAVLQQLGTNLNVGHKGNYGLISKAIKLTTQFSRRYLSFKSNWLIICYD